jgi:hypothetical protein
MAIPGLAPWRPTLTEVGRAVCLLMQKCNSAKVQQDLKIQILQARSITLFVLLVISCSLSLYCYEG